MKKMNSSLKSALIWMVIIFGVVGMARFFENAVPAQQAKAVSYSELVKSIQDGQAVAVTMQYDSAVSTLKDGSKIMAFLPPESGLTALTQTANVPLTVLPFTKKGSFSDVASWIFPIILLLFFIIMVRQMASANGKALNFGKSKARLLAEKGKVTFADVAGIDEAKQELEEIVDFLKFPAKFQRLGGKIPKGVLLIGPPGTGKTLLARAIAGEAKVPFFTISGSDFVEMFVGVGASRVRDMFEQAKKAAPCILFVDEIDAVGRHRGAGLGGGNDEREQTLNQLLVEMDGFEPNSGIILIAATNRPDVLDPALLRPGRFDRQIVVSNPDVKGREAILKVHVKKVPLAGDVKLSVLARGTPGFSGADLANLINEGALLAARRNKMKVNMRDLEDAKDKVMMGSERKSMVMDDNEKRMTAYHEAGHTIVSLYMPETDPVHKVTIIPRGRALGITMQLPEKDKYSQSKTYLKSRLAILFGGRIAEELILGPEHVSTGASNDIQVATSLARKMVAEWGMSSLGPIAFEEPEGEVFLGYNISKRKNIADATAVSVDKEIRLIIKEAYAKAKEILRQHKKQLDMLAEALINNETLTGEEVQKVIQGEKITKIKEVESPKGVSLLPDVKPQSGRTLIEMIGVICVMTVLTVSAFNAMTYGMMLIRVHKTQSDVEEIAAGVRQMYAWARNYGNINMKDLCQNDVLADACQGDMTNGVCTNNCHWLNPWGGSVTVAALANNQGLPAKEFRITYAGIPKDACHKLKTMQFRGVTLEDVIPKTENPDTKVLEPCQEEYNNTFIFVGS